jgi:hypothetical protein
MKADRLAGKVHANIPAEYKAHHDCLHFPEQNISLVLDGKKLTSRITRSVAHIIHQPPLEQYLREKECSNEYTWNEQPGPLSKLLSTRPPPPDNQQ